MYNSNLRKQWRTIAWFNCMPNLSLVKQPYKNQNDGRIKKLIENGSEGTSLYDWWQIEMTKNTSREKCDYVNQIPEEVVRRILLTTVPGGELVFEPFCGSGTTPSVADLLGYKVLATDVSPKAIEVARDRMQFANTSEPRTTPRMMGL